MEKCSFTQAEVHKMTSHCYWVNFISAAIILFPLTELWKDLERIKTGFETLIWYYNGYMEKKKKNYFWERNKALS